MMAQQLDVHVVTAPLVQIDRAALSQAWYSALHLARSHAPVANAGHASHATGRTAGSIAATIAGKASAGARGNGPAARGRSNAPSRPSARETQRTLEAWAQRRLARTVSIARGPSLRSTLTLGRGAGRVYLLLQSAGNATRAIAICRPADRERVAAALADACAALARRGIRLDARLGAGPCS